MPRAEAGTPKAIGNAIKAKGLQKLKFFCQSCQKQCRDANGFKCHTMSEAHQRQLLIVAENPNKFMDEFSKEYFRDFMQLFRTRFGGRRVYANDVYQEYIKDRYHVHMNSTRWLTLSAFVQWLGRHGHATVDRTEKGWYITYIDRDPETLAREESLKKKDKIEKDYEDRMSRVIEEQVQRGLNNHLSNVANDDSSEAANNELLRDSNEKIVLNINLSKRDAKSTDLVKVGSSRASEQATTSVVPGSEVKDRKAPADSVRERGNEKRITKSSTQKKRSALEEILEEEIKRKTKKVMTDTERDPSSWLIEGIVVKIVSDKLPDKYRNKKGTIEKVENRFTAFVRLQETGAVIKCDQSHLETVIPREGSRVRLVSGRYRGENASLLRVDVERLRISVRIESGDREGKRLDDLHFFEVSKI